MQAPDSGEDAVGTPVASPPAQIQQEAGAAGSLDDPGLLVETPTRR